ncbi:MAG: DNA-methyltransferase, partial [Acidimicrobiales bacterium]
MGPGHQGLGQSLTGGRPALERLLDEGVIHGDASTWLPRLPSGSVDLFFTSPPYADARSYARIHPDHYVEWFLPHARVMYEATAETGSLVLNIKNRVASRGPLAGQRHPYVYKLVLEMQAMGWRWIETYIWAKPNAVPGRFGPRTKDSFEYVFHFARGSKPYFDLDAVRVPYKASAAEIERRKSDRNGRRNTAAGFGRDRTKTYLNGGADPGNVVTVAQTYNQHRGVAHPAAM